MGRRLSHSHTDGTPLTCSFSIYSSPSLRLHTVRAELHTEDGPEPLAIQTRVSTVFLAGSITQATLWFFLLPGYLDVGGSCTASYPVCHRFSCSGPAELYTAYVSCDQSEKPTNLCPNLWMLVPAPYHLSGRLCLMGMMALSKSLGWVKQCPQGLGYRQCTPWHCPVMI